VPAPRSRNHRLDIERLGVMLWQITAICSYNRKGQRGFARLERAVEGQPRAEMPSSTT